MRSKSIAALILFVRGAAIAASAVLAACSGGGKGTAENPNTVLPTLPAYSGPAPSTADVQAFRINLWENVKADNRCGGCHKAGGQSPMFARQDDVNAAYEAANGVVNLTDPASSRLVTKVGGGHNCWLSAPSACADVMTTWIRNWAGSAATGGTQIQLVAPVLKDVGSSRNFPDTPPAAYGQVHTLLTNFCARCHTSDAATPQSPFFAAANINESYAAAKSKINLDDPAMSRLVVRLRTEFHNCWAIGGAPNCAGSANAMQAAIEGLQAAIPPAQVDPALTISKALTMYDGTIAAGGNRFDSNVIAKWEFKTGSGVTAFDTSGVEPAINLNMSGDVVWVGGWGINVRAGGKAQGSTASSKKLHDLIGATGEYSVEAWVAPANVAQEDAYIASYSGGAMARNFTIAQQQYQLEFANRSSTTTANGTPALVTDADDEDLQATLQHIVVTFDPTNGRRIYVNGRDTGERDPPGQSSIGDWDDTFAFVLGNEVSGARQFTGVYRLVAVHNRVLTAAQIQQNFEVGVGEKYYLLFSVAHLVDVPQSYILFEVSQFDSYGYLFNKPTFISLDANANPGSIPVRGVRIGENGAELNVGQAYRTLDTTISTSLYTPGVGQPLSGVGTVVPLQKGPMEDLFFLCFDRLGSRTQVCSQDAAPVTVAKLDVPRPSDIGVRTFDEINATMAAVTGVSPNDAGVKATYTNIRQSLPAVNNIQAFLASHQTAIAQLAIKYCATLVDSSARTSYFPALNWSSTLASQPDRDAVINPILDRIMGVNLGTQPDRTMVHDELNNLIDLAPNGLCRTAACGGVRTATVVKAVCGAALGSAVMVIK